MRPYFATTRFEVEGPDDMEEVLVYELHVTAALILGVFVWPKGWEWTFGIFPGLTGGKVLHSGPISFGWYYEGLVRENA